MPNLNTLAKEYEQELIKQFGFDKVETAVKAAQPINTALFANTGGLGQDLADSFIDLVVDESTLMQNISVLRTNFRSGEFTKLDVTGHVTEQASENNTSTETRKPQSTLLTYVTKKTRSQFDLTSEVIEDNIEGPSGQNTILNALLRHVRNDMETLLIEGDESVSATDDKSRLVKTNDGLNVLTSLSAGTHIVNAGNKRVSWELLRRMLIQMPTRYRRNRSAFRWIMSSNAVLDLLQEAEQRTTNLGDLMWRSDAPPAPLGIPILEVPLMPEDLSSTGTDSTSTIIWLCDPREFMWIVQRDMTVHSEFIPRYDRTEVTAYMRSDILVRNTDAVVKATNVNVDPAVDRFAAS